MMNSKPMPVLVGIGQLTNRSKDPEAKGDPIDYMVECAKRAAEDTGGPVILPQIDSMAIIRVISTDYTYIFWLSSSRTMKWVTGSLR